MRTLFVLAVLLAVPVAIAVSFAISASGNDGAAYVVMGGAVLLVLWARARVREMP